MKYLNHARLQLKGNHQGFIPETLEIFCWGKKIQIKLFALSERRYKFHGVQGTKWYTRREIEEDMDIRESSTAVPFAKTYSTELGNSKNLGEKILSMGQVGTAPPSHLDNNRSPVTYPAEGDH